MGGKEYQLWILSVEETRVAERRVREMVAVERSGRIFDANGKHEQKIKQIESKTMNGKPKVAITPEKAVGMSIRIVDIANSLSKERVGGH